MKTDIAICLVVVFLTLVYPLTVYKLSSDYHLFKAEELIRTIEKAEMVADAMEAGEQSVRPEKMAESVRWVASANNRLASMHLDQHQSYRHFLTAMLATALVQSVLLGIVVMRRYRRPE